MAWTTIRGHDAVVTRLEAAFTRNRLAHAYLLVGPPGVGKRRFAKEFAKAILCEKPPSPLTACDRCASCKLVAAGTHPDFRTITTPDDKQELPREVMDEFLHFLGLKPSRGERKVGFVEDAEDFNEESANLFLKTLEEPPPGSLLLLRSSTLESQLSTIQSRCQPLRFSSLSDVDVAAVLAEQGVEESRRARLVSLSRGSPGRAIAMNDPALDEFRRGLVEMLGAPKFNHAAFAERWAKFVEEAGKDGAAQRTRASLAVHLLIQLLETALRSTLAIDSPEAAALKPLAERAGTEKLLSALEACLDADRQVVQRAQLVLTLELLADRLATAA
jgi:DNA polymerase-3 subunit delta'